MIKPETDINLICEKAIPMPECPVSKRNAHARRIWLKLQIENLVNAERSRVRDIPGVAEDADRNTY